MTAETGEPKLGRPLSLALGGGGPFGIAYILGVSHALANGGVPLAGAEMLGTSAGAWAAAFMAAGVSYERLREVRQVRVPNQRRGYLQGIAAELLGDARSDLVTASAVRVPYVRRVFLSGSDHRLADIVAASSAVPTLFPPVRLDKSWYVDGGVRSLTSADHAGAAEHLLAIAPLAGPMFGPPGRGMELMLRRELARWQRRTGGKAHLVRPNARIAALARHPLQLFDVERAHEAYGLAYEQARGLLASRPGLAALADLRPLQAIPA